MNKKIKVFIAYDFGKITGGGSNFLERLSKQFEKNGVLSSLEDADVILYNSHHAIEKVSNIKKKYTNKIFVHRIDGPIRGYNGEDDKRDDIVVEQNKLSNGNVFQSLWSRDENISRYPSFGSKDSCVIHNACLFSPPKKYRVIKEKINIISISNSMNVNKGFPIYEYLDKNLNFSKYNFHFSGRSPIRFKNIKELGVIAPEKIESELHVVDIYLMASKLEACSNSLVEALAAGLPCLAINGSSNKEILKDGGLLFNGESDILSKIDELSSNLEKYRNQISVDSMEVVADKYLHFFGSLIK